MSFKINWDALGITTSILCAVHCAILPLMVASLPILGVNIIENAAFEYGMIVLAMLIGARALRHGYRKHHRHPGPALLFSTGMIFLLAKQIWHSHQLFLLPFAVILIVSAHILNFRLFSRQKSVPGSSSGRPTKHSAPQLP